MDVVVPVVEELLFLDQFRIDLQLTFFHIVELDLALIKIEVEVEPKFPIEHSSLIIIRRRGRAIEETSEEHDVSQREPIVVVGIYGIEDVSIVD